MLRLLPLVALTACAPEDPNDTDPLSEGPLYAVMYEIFDDVGSSSYLSIVDDLDDAVIDTSTAREFIGGRAYLQAYGGWVFIGEPTSPVVHRYDVAADGGLTNDVEVSFANYGLESGLIDPWSVTFVSRDKAYLYDYREGTHIIWNPTTMEIVGDIPPPPELVREGLSLDGSPGVVRDGMLYRTAFWANFDTAEYSSDQLLLVVDTASDSIVDIATDTRCQDAGNLVHEDEEGNLYFSNWIWPVAGTLLWDAPQSCVLRIPPDSDHFDPDWSLSYQDVAGHEGAMFTYLSDGQGLVAVFDESKKEITAKTDPWALAGSPFWSIWNVDVETGTGSPVKGIPPNTGAYTPARFDDRTFLLVPTADWAATELYELEGDTAERSFDVPGWSFAFVQIR